MKRVGENISGERLRRRALEEVRAARLVLEKHHPELLETVRESLKKAEKANACSQGIVEEKVDRKKNLETVLKFIALKPQSGDLKTALEKLLS
ncbi:MAG: hypothetical protein IT559_05225 [Alphaproteobacteria bacterium]|nr:hypothetical protein [Alphaproteobacteria bacterium]